MNVNIKCIFRTFLLYHNKILPCLSLMASINGHLTCFLHDEDCVGGEDTTTVKYFTNEILQCLDSQKQRPGIFIFHTCTVVLVSLFTVFETL